MPYSERVTKMKLSADKQSIQFNPSLVALDLLERLRVERFVLNMQSRQFLSGIGEGLELGSEREARQFASRFAA